MYGRYVAQQADCTLIAQVRAQSRQATNGQATHQHGQELRGANSIMCVTMCASWLMMVHESIGTLRSSAHNETSMQDLMKLQCIGVNAHYCAYVMEIYSTSMHKSKGA